MTRLRFSEQEVQEIIKLHAEGKSPKEIGLLFNTFNTSIRRVLLRNNVKLKDQSEAQATFLINPFKNYNTEEWAAYWLGYLIADGNIGISAGFRATINTNKDPEHLQKYGDWIGRPMLKVLNKKYNVWEYNVSFYNKAIIKELISWGIMPAKSSIIEKTPMNRHILRGYFDGNGGIIRDGRISITCGSEKYTEFLVNFINKNNIRTVVYKDKRGKGCWNLYIFEHKKFYNLLYKNSTIFMQRKEHLLGQFVSNDNLKIFSELQETPEVDNLQPSSENSIVVSEKVQRLTGEELTNNPDTSAEQP